jgi:hypothetical protein
MVVHYPKPTTEETAALKPAFASIPAAIAYLGGPSRSKFYADILPRLQTVNWGTRKFVVVSSMDQLIVEETREGAESLRQQNEPGDDSYAGFDKPPEEVDIAVVEVVLASDAQFFIDHPNATGRTRDFVSGECPLHVPPGHRAIVRVYQVVPVPLPARAGPQPIVARARTEVLGHYGEGRTRDKAK